MVDSGAAEDEMLRSMFPEISTEETEDSKDQGESTSRTTGKKSCPLELLRNSHVARRRREKAPGVRIPHHSLQRWNLKSKCLLCWSSVNGDTG